MLSKEQQDMIEKNLWVVNAVLKKQGLQGDEDLKQSAILYMCRCVERYDPSKNIEWSTFAYKNVYLFVKRFNKQQQQKSRNVILKDNLFYLADQEEYVEVYELNTAEEKLEALKRFCTSDERKCIELKLKGYKWGEIGEMLNCSSSKLIGCMRNVKIKAKQFYEEIMGGEKE